jgi:iron complex transport system substrate-binding protein
MPVKPWVPALLGCCRVLLSASLLLSAGCQPDRKDSAVNAPVKQTAAFVPMEISHQLGRAIIRQQPERIAVLDMNDVDHLHLLQVPIAGMPKDYVPAFLAELSQDPNIMDLGAIVQPNLERIYKLKPDLILLSSLQASHYPKLAALAPSIHYDIDYQLSGSGHIDKVISHFHQLAQIFGKEQQAEQQSKALLLQWRQLQQQLQHRPERAMILLHNNGAFSYLGEQSRYGFIYRDLQVKAAGDENSSGLHGQPVSNEYIFAHDPDIIFVIDRTAVMAKKQSTNTVLIDNPLIRQTKAWKNNKIIVVDAQAWYVTGASMTALQQIITDVQRGYQ